MPRAEAALLVQLTIEGNKLMNSLLLRASKLSLLQGDMDYKLVRAAMVLTFYIFSIQKWSAYTSQLLVPMISHSPVVFWLEPVFGVRGAGFFLGASELTFGTLILLGYWSRKLGVLGALGSIVTFVGTTSIIFFLPDAWAKEAGGFPIMTLPLGFLMKDFLFLAVSFYLLKRDLQSAASEVNSTSFLGFPLKAARRAGRSR
jgi:uncharacterized membrane protein YkgB